MQNGKKLIGKKIKELTDVPKIPMHGANSNVIALLCSMHNILESMYVLNPLFRMRNHKNNGKEWGYYLSSPYSVYTLSKLLVRYKRKCIMDLGCGMGVLLLQLKALIPGFDVRGIDNDRILVNMAKTILGEHTCIQGDLQLLTKGELGGCDTFFIWEPIRDEVMVKSFVTRLEKYMKKDDMIFYIPAGITGRELRKTETIDLIATCGEIEIYKKL